MPYSLSAPSVESLKSEARLLREERGAAGEAMTHSAALEAVAHAHGYRDWNTAHASLPRDIAPPVQVGQRVTGTYLGHPFTGLVRSVSMIDDGRYFDVIFHFDTPVDVVTFDSFSLFRQRVSARVDAYGRSPAVTSDGRPHMQIDLSAPAGGKGRRR